jgi:hypothetical protein
MWYTYIVSKTAYEISPRYDESAQKADLGSHEP